jgi:curli biogenesis system outer membrane secretion channel CsgG
MKKISYVILTGLFLVPGVYSFAQCKLTSGDISVLKGQDEVNLQFDYSKMAVGKFKTEDEYVNNKKSEMNRHKAGSGDDWAEKWKNDKTDKYQPGFERGMNMVLANFNFKARENAVTAKYTLIVHTTFLEIGTSSMVGYGFGPAAHKEAYISVSVDLVETADPSKVLATIDMKRENSEYQGGWTDVDTGSRVEGSYMRAGQDLAGFIYKTNYK